MTNNTTFSKSIVKPAILPQNSLYFLNSEEQHKIIIETEEAILCSMLLDNQSIDFFRSTITIDYFFTNQAKIIYQACIDVYDYNNIVTLALLKNNLISIGKYALAGGEDKIERILSRASVSVDVQSSVKILLEKYLRDILQKEGGNIKETALNFGERIETILADVDERLSKIKQVASKNKDDDENSSWENLAVDIVDNIVTTWDGTINQTVFNSGLHDLDDALGGFSPPDFIMIAGPSGIGKTAFGCSLMLDFVKQGISCLFLSGEMSAEQVGARVLAAQTGIDSKLLVKKKKNLNQQQITQLFNAVAQTSTYPMSIISCGPGIPEIKAAIKKATKKALDDKMPNFDGKYKVIFLDYLQLLSRGENGSDNRSLEIDALAQWCKHYAKDNNCVFIAFAQINDDVLSGTGNKIPNINDVGWCRTAKNHADYLLFLWTEYYNSLNTKNQMPNRPEQEILQIHFRKSRHTGFLGVVETLFTLPLCRVVSLYRKNP